MKKTFKELKREARAALKGKWGEGVLLVFVLLLFAFLCDLPSGYYQISHPGYQQDMMNYGIQWGFGNYFHNIGGMLLMIILIFLWSLLLLIPGIIKSFAYAMTPFVLVDNPELPCYEAIKRSQELMKGNKWRYFLLALSFLGWILLGILSLGIGFFWIIPYIETTTAAFYYDIKAQKGL